MLSQRKGLLKELNHHQKELNLKKPKLTLNQKEPKVEGRGKKSLTKTQSAGGTDHKTSYFTLNQKNSANTIVQTYLCTTPWILNLKKLKVKYVYQNF